MVSLLIALIVISLLAISIAVLSEDNDNIIESSVKAQARESAIETVDRLLPQTQCGDCGFNGCLPYAEALVKNQTDINRCLPGGDDTVNDLADFFGKEIKPLYKDAKDINTVAIIDETVCIGCVKCINACPVDAIVGAPKQMHSIINQYCTGCELCIAPCPVDCISMVAAS